jgi:hypothetical protein
MLTAERMISGHAANIALPIDRVTIASIKPLLFALRLTLIL